MTTTAGGSPGLTAPRPAQDDARQDTEQRHTARAAELDTRPTRTAPQEAFRICRRSRSVQVLTRKDVDNAQPLAHISHVKSETVEQRLKHLETPAFNRALAALMQYRPMGLRTVGNYEDWITANVDHDAALAWRAYKELEALIP